MNTYAEHSSPSLQCYVQSIAVLGPGLPDWVTTQAVLCDQAFYRKNELQIPSPACLPARERRRIGNRVRLALAAGQAAIDTTKTTDSTTFVDVGELATVFSSSSGDGDNCHALFTALAHNDSSMRFVSPTCFHNSVHNAPAGYWGIASLCMLPSTSLCAYDASFAAGLLEACCQCMATKKQILFVCSDAIYPQPLYNVRPVSNNFAVAMVINAVATNTSLIKLTLKLKIEQADRMKTPELEALRLSNPSARCLPLLQVIARKTDQSGQNFPEIVFLEYLAPLSLEILVE